MRYLLFAAIAATAALAYVAAEAVVAAVYVPSRPALVEIRPAPFEDPFRPTEPPAVKRTVRRDPQPQRVVDRYRDSVQSEVRGIKPLDAR